MSYRLIGTADVKPPAPRLLRRLGLEPDPWQVQALEGGFHQLLVNGSRQAGKTTLAAVLSLMEAVWMPDHLVLLVSRDARQARKQFRRVASYHRLLDSIFLCRRTAEELEFTNGSRVVCLPGTEGSVRGDAEVGLLVLDDAARIADDVYRAVRPLLAVSEGRLVCLSAPCGRRGFFYEEWTRGGPEWQRLEVPVAQVPRIKPAFLERERRALGPSWFRQEYGCSFEALEGLVYPDFGRCVVREEPPAGRWVGGIDFGLRNPFAAVWGVLDREEILRLTGEHYSREGLLRYHAERLPRQVTWYTDPEGAREILELQSAGLTIEKADNDRTAGIAAVRARLENGTLRVVADRCPNLLAEAGLYRYDPRGRSETPLKEHDHALDVLRYLVSRIDVGVMGRLRNDFS
jgi:hypothetical protein